MLFDDSIFLPQSEFLLEVIKENPNLTHLKRGSSSNSNILRKVALWRILRISFQIDIFQTFTKKIHPSFLFSLTLNIGMSWLISFWCYIHEWKFQIEYFCFREHAYVIQIFCLNYPIHPKKINNDLKRSNYLLKIFKILNCSFVSIKKSLTKWDKICGAV